MVLLVSFLSSTSAAFSSLLMLLMGVLIFFKMVFISPLCSSALPCFSFMDAFSMAQCTHQLMDFLAGWQNLVFWKRPSSEHQLGGYYRSCVPIFLPWCWSLLWSLLLLELSKVVFSPSKLFVIGFFIGLIMIYMLL